MAWISLGKRRDYVLEKNLKFLALSQSLSRYGCAYHSLLSTRDGDFFVEDSEHRHVISCLSQQLHFKDIIPLMNESSSKIVALSSDPLIHFDELIDSISHYLMLFHVGKLLSDLEYSSASLEEKDTIERWRNDASLFDCFDAAYASLAQSLSLSEEVLFLFLADELKEFINTRSFDREELRKREHDDWYLELKEENIGLVYGSKLPDISSSSGPLQGDPVFHMKKKIRGIVGKDIFVTTMTTVDMLPLALRMKAIITDEGGLLSHAAILAREHSLPCIVNTKIATQVLHDGDEVELDLETGIIVKM